MFRRTLLILLLLPSLGRASNLEIASDVTVPFRLNVQGKGNSGQENLMLGTEFRYDASDLAQWGFRFQVDLDRYRGAFRRWGIAPFLTEHWMWHETWHPYARFELPFLLKGAPNNLGSDSKLDLGLGGGVGVAWRIENSPLAIYYDFGFHYFFGIGDALSILSIDLFRIGMAYRF
jgi:hypothetical protein